MVGWLGWAWGVDYRVAPFDVVSRVEASAPFLFDRPLMDRH